MMCLLILWFVVGPALALLIGAMIREGDRNDTR